MTQPPDWTMTLVAGEPYKVGADLDLVHVSCPAPLALTPSELLKHLTKLTAALFVIPKDGQNTPRRLVYTARLYSIPSEFEVLPFAEPVRVVGGESLFFSCRDGEGVPPAPSTARTRGHLLIIGANRVCSHEYSGTRCLKCRHEDHGALWACLQRNIGAKMTPVQGPTLKNPFVARVEALEAAPHIQIALSLTNWQRRQFSALVGCVCGAAIYPAFTDGPPSGPEARNRAEVEAFCAAHRGCAGRR